MRVLGAILLTAVLLAARTQAQVTEPPLFVAFKEFCVDTGAKPEAVKATVEAAGGAMKNQNTTAGPLPMTTIGWDLTVMGQPMMIAASTARVPAKSSRPGTDSNACTVDGNTDDDAGLMDVVQRWVGLPPVGDTSGITTYYFQQAGSEHAAILNEKDKTSASAEGREWTLVVIHVLRGSIGLQLLNSRTAP